jgi:hypothetical protein
LASSPSGERLAISLMSGPDAADQAGLYIVDGVSGQVQKRVPLESGETVRFWQPAVGGGFYRALPAPGGEVLVVVASGDGLYYIPLPPAE